MKYSSSFNYVSILISLLFLTDLNSQCNNAVIINGDLKWSVGVPRSHRADGAPDGRFTLDISGNSDDLYLEYRDHTNELIEASLCATVAFEDEDDYIRIIINEDYFSLDTLIRNPTGDDDFNTQEICIPVLFKQDLDIRIKHQYAGNNDDDDDDDDDDDGSLRFDGSTLTYCPCNSTDPNQDCDKDGIANGQDAEPENPCTADGTVDGIEPKYLNYKQS